MSTREITLEGGSPWGFRIHGGADTNQPLRVSRVNPGSGAAQRGVREGDLISTINGQPTRQLTNSEAHQLLRTAGNTLVLGLNQESGGSPKRRAHRVQEHKEKLIERTPESEKHHQKSTTQLKNGYSTDSRGCVEKDYNEKNRLIEKSLTDATALHATMPGGVSRSRKRKTRSNRKKKHSVERENSNEQSVERQDISDDVNSDKKSNVVDKETRLEPQMCSNVNSMNEKQLVESQTQQCTNKQKSITEIIEENYNKSIKMKEQYNKISASQQENLPSTSTSYQEKTSFSTKSSFQEDISIENISSRSWTSAQSSSSKSSREKNKDCSSNKSYQPDKVLHQDLLTKSSMEVITLSSGTVKNRKQATTFQQDSDTKSSIQSCIPVKQSSKLRTYKKKDSKKLNTLNKSLHEAKINLSEDSSSDTSQQELIMEVPQNPESTSDQVPITIDDESNLRSPRDIASQENPFHKEDSPIPYIDDATKFPEINNNCNKQEEISILELGSTKLTQIEGIQEDSLKTTIVKEINTDENGKKEESSVLQQIDFPDKEFQNQDHSINISLQEARSQIENLEPEDVKQKLYNSSRFDENETVISMQELKHNLDQENLNITIQMETSTTVEELNRYECSALSEENESVISKQKGKQVSKEPSGNKSINITKVEIEIPNLLESTKVVEEKIHESSSTLETDKSVIFQQEEKQKVSEKSSETAKMNSTPLIEKIKGSSSFDEDKYIVESPKSTRIVNGQVVKSRSLEDDVIKITEIVTDDELVSDCEKCLESNKAVISEPESDDLEWETTEDLRSDSQSLHYGKLSIISLPLVEHRIENVSNISPEEEKNLRSFLEALNLGTPEECKKGEKVDSKATRKAKKRAAIAQHFLPYFHNPRYLDVISEEGSDLSDSDLRKETMSMCHTRPLIINPYWPSGNPLEHLTLTNEAILVGTKMIESGIEKQKPLQEASWSFVTEAHECSGQPEVVYLDEDSSESMTPSELLEQEEALDADAEDEESEIERSLDECLELENNLRKNLNKSITNISNIHVFSVNSQDLASDYDYKNTSPEVDKKVDLPLLVDDLPHIDPKKDTQEHRGPIPQELIPDSDKANIIKDLEVIINETGKIQLAQEDLPVLNLSKTNNNSKSCEANQMKIVKNLEDIISEIENITIDSNISETSKSIKLSTAVRGTSDINLFNEIGKDFDRDVFLNEIMSMISVGDRDKVDKLINDPRFEMLPNEIKEMVGTLRKYLNCKKDQSSSSEVLITSNDDMFNKEFRTFCEGLMTDGEISRSGSSNSERSSRSTSQCTAVYNPIHSSLTNIAALLKEDGTGSMEQPHSLKDICVQQLLKMPFGTEVIEELAKVSSNIEEMTNNTSKTKTDWVGMPLEENPSVIVCLSPAQKSYIETIRNTPKEADSLLDLHQKYIDRQYPQVSKQSKEDITISALHVDGKNSHQKWKDFRSASVREVPKPSKRASSYIDYQNFMREYQKESQNPDDFDGSIKDDGNINYNSYIKKVTREVPIQVEKQFHRPVNNLVYMEEETEASKQRLNAKHVSEWLNIARKDLHKVRAPLMRYHSCDGLDTPDYRRRSLPQELYERQMQYILNKEHEIQMEIDRLEEEKQKLELMEKSKSEGDLKHLREKKFFDASNYQISKKGDIAILNTDRALPSETFRQKMFDEWVNKMAEREERKQHKVIKITSTTTTTHQESSETVEIRHNVGIEDEFMEKVKKRNSKLGLEEEIREENPKMQDSDPVKIIDGSNVSESTILPKHLQEFVEYINKNEGENNTKAKKIFEKSFLHKHLFENFEESKVREFTSKSKTEDGSKVDENSLLDNIKANRVVPSIISPTVLQENDSKQQEKTILVHPITIIDKNLRNTEEIKICEKTKSEETKISSKSEEGQKIEEKSHEMKSLITTPKEEPKVLVHPIELVGKNLRNEIDTKHQKIVLPNMEIKDVETKKINTERTLFSKHFQDFVKYLNDRSDPGVWSPNKSTEIQQFQNETVEKPTPITKDKEKDRGGGRKGKKDDPIATVWTPSSANASPVPERKEFRPINFESPILDRKNRSKESTPVTTPDSIASVPPPWEQSQEHKSEQDRRPLSSSHSAPTAGLSSLAGTKLPKAQNPTITLLQKAREGQLPRGACYIEESTTSHQRRIKDDRPPLVGQHEVPVYVIKSEYMKETDSDKPKKMADLGPRKFEGIGPTTKDGMPIAIRSEVKDANQHKWYKRMYDTLHKTKPDDDYVTVRYKTRRGRYPYTSAGGYLSEPEPNAYDSDASQTSTSKYATLDRRRLLVANDKENEYITYTVPRSNRYMSASVRHTNEVYKNQPGRIENYVPGRSSISEKEAKEWWDEVMEIFDGHLEQQKHVPQKSFMSHALKESGYESDSQLVFRRREDGLMRLPDPVEQRQAYKEIQKGGEVPLHGLRKPAPERPKEPPPAPTPPPKGVYHGHSDREEESPRRYVENEVTIHYRSPVRQEIKEIVSEEELARRQADAMRRIYQEERRRKYIQELQDMNSRRHGDNFIPSQKSPISLNRYDNFLDEVGGPTVKTLVRESSPEPRIVARALYNFVGQTSKELTFRKGDLIYIRRQVDKNWYEGEHNAMIGLFPSNYVEIVPYDKSRPTVRKPHEGQARAKFNFIAQTPIELSLAKGELVVLTRRVDQNWFEGRIGGRVGIFPVSYVDILIDPQSSDQRIEFTSSKPVASPASHSLVIQNGSSTGHHYQPGAYKGQSIEGSFRAKPAQVTNSLTRTSQKTAINQVLHIDTHNDPVPYRAMYKYRPQNDDELELIEGDTVFVIEKCDDGWFVGSSQRTGAFGTFPGNYVERI